MVDSPESALQSQGGGVCPAEPGGRGRDLGPCAVVWVSARAGRLSRRVFLTDRAFSHIEALQ